MKRLNRLGLTVVILGLAMFGSMTAQADVAADREIRDFSKMAPSATMDFEITSVKLIAGAAWGSGTLHFQGKSYPLKVSAASAGGVGYRSIKGSGKVDDLNKLEDFPGI